MPNEQPRQGNTPNQGGARQSGSGQPNVDPNRDRYAEGAPDSSRQFGEASGQSGGGRGQSGGGQQPPGGRPGQNQPAPGSSDDTETPYPGTGRRPSGSQDRDEDEAESPTTPVDDPRRIESGQKSGAGQAPAGQGRKSGS